MALLLWQIGLVIQLILFLITTRGDKNEIEKLKGTIKKMEENFEGIIDILPLPRRIEMSREAFVEIVKMGIKKEE